MCEREEGGEYVREKKEEDKEQADEDSQKRDECSDADDATAPVSTRKHARSTHTQTSRYAIYNQLDVQFSKTGL